MSFLSTTPVWRTSDWDFTRTVTLTGSPSSYDNIKHAVDVITQRKTSSKVHTTTPVFQCLVCWIYIFHSLVSGRNQQSNGWRTRRVWWTWKRKRKHGMKGGVKKQRKCCGMKQSTKMAVLCKPQRRAAPLQTSNTHTFTFSLIWPQSVTAQCVSHHIIWNNTQRVEQ